MPEPLIVGLDHVQLTLAAGIHGAGVAGRPAGATGLRRRVAGGAYQSPLLRTK